MARRASLLLLVLAAVGCMSADATETRPSNVPGGSVLYSIGVSSDPYGNSSPAGFGIISDPTNANAKPVEVRREGLTGFAGATWLDRERVHVPGSAPPFVRPLIYRFSNGRLTRLGRSPLPPVEPSQLWSPDGRLIASAHAGRDHAGPGHCSKQGGLLESHPA